MLRSEEEVMEACQRRGVEAVKAEQEGAVLILRGSPGQELPGVEDLRGLVEDLRKDGVRYITWELCDE